MKTIRLEYNGKVYDLCYTKRTIMQMESQGFVLTDLDKKPETMFGLLFRGAFYAKCKTVPAEIIDEIYAHIPRKEEFIGKLAEMYSEHIEALMAEPDEGDEGNAKWGASW